MLWLLGRSVGRFWRTIRADWEQRVVGTRSDAAARILIDRLPEMTIVNVTGLSERIGRTFAATNNAIDVLVRAGILVPTKKNGGSGTYEAKEIIDAFTLLERQLACPDANTRVLKPKRRVPARPTAISRLATPRKRRHGAH